MAEKEQFVLRIDCKIDDDDDEATNLTVTQDELVETFLKLEEIDTNLYRAHHIIGGRTATTRVYGGQVIGQALVAAINTVPKPFNLHSLHCYFIKPADKTKPILYQVDRVRDSRSFCTRFVKAIQNGENLCTCQLSFHKDEPDSISHQTPMPDVPPPEECETADTFLQRYFTDPSKLSQEGVKAIDAFRKVLDFPTTFDLKLINPRQNIQVPIGGPLKFQAWVKAKMKLGEDTRLHHCVAAFISDITPIGTPIGAHAGAGFRLGMAASLDHSIWIHRPHFPIDDWVLYETESTAAAACRALIYGKMWTRDGLLVMSTAQEALIRGEREENK